MLFFKIIWPALIAASFPALSPSYAKKIFLHNLDIATACWSVKAVPQTANTLLSCRGGGKKTEKKTATT